MLIYEEEVYQRSKKILEATRDAIKKNILHPASEMYLWDIAEDVAWYERAKNGSIDLETNLEYIGASLIAARIARKWSQKELAGKVKVPESTISDHEENRYYGCTIDFIRQIAVLLGVRIDINVRLSKKDEWCGDYYATRYPDLPQPDAEYFPKAPRPTA